MLLSFFFWHYLIPLFTFYRSPALIGCFVVDRKYFEEIGLLDEGMEIYGGENVELGIRVSQFESLHLLTCTPVPTICYNYTCTAAYSAP